MLYSCGDGVILLHDPHKLEQDAVSIDALIKKSNPNLVCHIYLILLKVFLINLIFSPNASRIVFIVYSGEGVGMLILEESIRYFHTILLLKIDDKFGKLFILRITLILYINVS